MKSWEKFQRAYPGARTPWIGEGPLREAFAHASESLVSFVATLGSGPVGIGDGQVFTLEEARERRESALEQLSREREEAVELGPQCFGLGHEEAQECLDAMAKVAPVVRNFYPLMGPDHVHDFIYVVLGGEWHGRVGTWYHDYPVCELFEEAPEHASLDDFAQDLLRAASEGDESLL